MRIKLAALVIAISAFVPQAHADEVQATTTKGTDHKAVVSVSPFRAAVAKMGELGVEVRFHPKMSAAVTAGFGPMNIDSRDDAGDFGSEKVLCFSSGAQFRYYALGTFDRGLFGGAETVFIKLKRDTASTIRPPHEGLWIGPTVGYKYTFGFGMALTAVMTVGLPVYKPDGLDEDEIPGDSQADSVPVAGGVLLWPNVSVGWAL